MSKLCLILSGQMRTFDCKKIVDSYNRYLSSYEVDLYLFTWTNRGYSNNHGNTDVHSLQEEEMTKTMIESHYSQFPFVTIRTIMLDNFCDFVEALSEPMKKIYHTPFRNHSKVTTSIPIEYKYQQAIQFLETVDTSYSRVMMTRPDMALVNELPLTPFLENNIYYINTCVRCMDHGWFSTSNTALKLLKTLSTDYLENHQTITSLNHDNKDNNELLLYQCFIQGIKVNVLEGKLFHVCHFKK